MPDGSIFRSDLDGGIITVIIRPGGTFTPKQIQIEPNSQKLLVRSGRHASDALQIPEYWRELPVKVPWRSTGAAARDAAFWTAALHPAGEGPVPGTRADEARAGAGSSGRIRRSLQS
jgi:hypothetical protein